MAKTSKHRQSFRHDVLVIGGGAAGISVAWQLAVKHGMKNVVLVDERPPMTLTSDKSTEAYRNWWPDPDDAMVRLMNSWGPRISERTS